MPGPRAQQPLNPAAVRAADEAVYRDHAGDPRPNALYDAGGNRRPLSATAPDQACLREEWLGAYEKSGGKVDRPPPGSSKPVGSGVAPCPSSAAATPPPTTTTTETSNLTVTVKYNVITSPVKDVDVTITGPTTQTVRTGADGIAEFKDIPPGQYDVTAVYKGTHPLVEKAKAQIGSKTWAYDADRSPYHPPGSNKCNGFVRDMAMAAGHAVPLRVRQRDWVLFNEDVDYPPLARQWADPSETIGSSVVVTDPQPGDVIAWSKAYADASGHMGILGYPQDGAGTVDVPAASSTALDVEMRRLTISAAHEEVLNNGWGWRPEQAGETFTYRRFP